MTSSYSLSSIRIVAHNSYLFFPRHRLCAFPNETQFPKKDFLVLKPQISSSSPFSLLRLKNSSSTQPFAALSSFAESDGDAKSENFEVKSHQESAISSEDEDNMPGMAQAFNISSSTGSAISICIALAALILPFFMKSLGQGLGFKYKILSYVTILFGFYMAWNIGANDVANAMGTSVGSGALSLRQAVIMAGVLEFSGALLMGTHVTNTMQKGILVANVFQGKDTLLFAGLLSSLAAAGTWLQFVRLFIVLRKKPSRSLHTFMEFKKTYEELNVLLPFSVDIKVQQAQREQMAIMSFLAGLPSEFETAKSQILSSSEITSLKDVFSRVLCTESTPPNQHSNVLVAKGGRNNAGRWNDNNDAGKLNHNNDAGKWSQNNDAGRWSQNNDAGRWNNNNNAWRWNNNKGGDNDNTCRYCKEPGHIKRNCKKLQARNQQVQTATVAAASSSPSTVTISADEYARLTKYQESVNQTIPAHVLTDSGSYDEADYW